MSAQRITKSTKVTETKIDVNSETLGASLGYSLRRAQLSTFDEFTESMKGLDIRPSQFAVLVLIRSNPGLNQSAISGELGIQKANFVSLLDSLEARGLTERRRVEGDRRSCALYLTRSGEAFFRKMEGAHSKLEEQLTLRLGHRRSRQLLNLLHEFTKNSTY